MSAKNSFWQRGQSALRSAGRLLKPYPLRSTANKLSCTPFFIVSAGRSGTTLLQAILTQQSEICIPPESDMLGSLIAEYQQTYCRLSWREIVTLFCGKLACGMEFCHWDILLKGFNFEARKIPEGQRSLARLIDLYFQFFLKKHAPEATRWGDKTPHYVLWLPQIDSVFPEAQYVHIFRDGRDVVASYLQLGWVRSVADGCDMWLSRIQAAMDYSQRTNGRKFLMVRYESLVQTPEPVIQQVCNFLGLNYRPEMLDFHKNPDQFRGDLIRPNIHPMLAQPISTQSIGKWRQVLDPEQQLYVQERLGKMLVALEYEVN